MNKRILKTMALALTVGTLQVQATPGAAIKALASTVSKITPATAAGVATGLGCEGMAIYHLRESDNPSLPYFGKGLDRAGHLIVGMASMTTLGLAPFAIGLSFFMPTKFGSPMLRFGTGVLSGGALGFLGLITYFKIKTNEPTK